MLPKQGTFQSAFSPVASKMHYASTSMPLINTSLDAILRSVTHFLSNVINAIFIVKDNVYIQCIS